MRWSPKARKQDGTRRRHSAVAKCQIPANACPNWNFTFAWFKLHWRTKSDDGKHWLRHFLFPALCTDERQSHQLEASKEGLWSVCSLSPGTSCAHGVPHQIWHHSTRRGALAGRNSGILPPSINNWPFEGLSSNFRLGLMVPLSFLLRIKCSSLMAAFQTWMSCRCCGGTSVRRWACRWEIYKTLWLGCFGALPSIFVSLASTNPCKTSCRHCCQAFPHACCYGRSKLKKLQQFRSIGVDLVFIFFVWSILTFKKSNKGLPKNDFVVTSNEYVFGNSRLVPDFLHSFSRSCERHRLKVGSAVFKP